MGGTIINMKKPMKTVRELIQHMKNKGIGFNIINEVEAEEHLNNHNNYFKNNQLLSTTYDFFQKIANTIK